MSIPKILGGILVVTVGFLAARIAAKHEKKRLTVLDAWIELLFYIRGQIDCYLMPLRDILAAADKTLLTELGEPLNATLPALLASSAPYLDTESQRLLGSLIREIGTSYREEQVKRCDYYLGALRRQREKLAAELPAKLKLSATLCLCAAVGTAILLW